MADKIHICVIDDGISESEISVFKNMQIKNGKVVCFLGQCSNISHGTACAKLIEKYAEKEILVSSVLILNKQYKGNVNSLYAAFEWCMENDVNIINLSLGSVFFKDKEILLGIVNRCVEKGMIIIAATANEGYTTYPASFTNVLGVKSFDEKEKKACSIRYDTNLGFGVFETEGSNKINIAGEEKITKWCNSIATPYITAKIVNIYTPGITVQAVREIYTDKNLKINCFETDWVVKAYAIDVVEIFPELCHFNLINEDDSIQDVDTVILQVKDDINKWLKNGKNIIYIGNDIIDYVSNRNYIWSKYNRMQQIQYNKIDKHDTLDVPVIYIKGEHDLKYVYMLSRFFREKNYNAYSISHNILYELYGITYIPTEIIDNKTDNFVKNELYYKQADILLYDICEADEKLALNMVRLSPDVIVETKKTNVIISSEWGVINIPDSIESVGKYIIYLLEGECEENEQ